MHDGCILLAAQAMGGAQQALDITVQYAKDREQFDKPLGAFQAIAHYLADAVTAVDGGTTLVHEAAWARAEGRPVDKLAPMAKLFACRTYRDVTAMAQQVFGGIGFTVDFDIQLYFRRAKAAPGFVVGHPLSRGARGRGRARRARLRRRQAEAGLLAQGVAGQEGVGLVGPGVAVGQAAEAGRVRGLDEVGELVHQDGVEHPARHVAQAVGDADLARPRRAASPTGAAGCRPNGSTRPARRSRYSSASWLARRSRSRSEVVTLGRWARTRWTRPSTSSTRSALLSRAGTRMTTRPSCQKPLAVLRRRGLVRTSTGGSGGFRSLIAGPRRLATGAGQADADVSLEPHCPPQTPSH